MEAELASARAVHFAALTLLFGGLLFPHYALPREARRAPRAFVGAFYVATAAALLSGLLVFGLTIDAMAGAAGAMFDPTLMGTMLVGGDLGWRTIGETVALLAVFVVLLGGGATGATAPLLAGAALASLATTGHAREGIGITPILHMGVDALHLLCAGLWIGALPWIAWAVIPRGGDTAAGLAAVRRFSRVGMGTVALLLLTGAVQTLLLVPNPLSLFATLWGRLLLAKIALTAAMVGLALANRRALAQETSEGASALRRNAGVELAFALLVLALVGVIGRLPFDA